MAETTQWHRTVFSSVWAGPDLELIVVQNGRSSENWKWTCRGWREPDECDESDSEGWVGCVSREEAEKSALQWYMQKDD